MRKINLMPLGLFAESISTAYFFVEILRECAAKELAALLPAYRSRPLDRFRAIAHRRPDEIPQIPKIIP